MSDGRMQIFEMATMCGIPMALNAVVKLNVPEIIFKAGENARLSAQEIIENIPGYCMASFTSACYLERILRVLASREIFAMETDRGIRRFGLTGASRSLVKDENGASLESWVLLSLDKMYLKPWDFLHEAVLEGGQPFTMAHGKTEFELAEEDPRINQLFNEAMTNHSKLWMTELVKIYHGFADLKTLVDVGGGVGTCLEIILATYPDMRCINFDLPHVISQAPNHDRIEYVSGDMFASVPQSDAFFMKWILHDWDDDKCIKILRNCHRSLSSNGKVIVVDSVLPTEDGSADHDNLAARCALNLDLAMLAHTPGGKERTEEEFQQLGRASGFSKVQIVATLDYLSVLEFLL